MAVAARHQGGETIPGAANVQIEPGPNAPGAPADGTGTNAPFSSWARVTETSDASKMHT